MGAERPGSIAIFNLRIVGGTETGELLHMANHGGCLVELSIADLDTTERTIVAYVTVSFETPE